VRDKLATEDANRVGLRGGISDDPLVAQGQMLSAVAEGSEQWGIGKWRLGRYLKRYKKSVEQMEDMTTEEQEDFLERIRKENAKIAKFYRLNVREKKKNSPPAEE
jgi:hypothetical protein